MTYTFLTSNNTATDTVERNTCKIHLIFIKRDIWMRIHTSPKFGRALLSLYFIFVFSFCFWLHNTTHAQTDRKEKEAKKTTHVTFLYCPLITSYVFSLYMYPYSFHLETVTNIGLWREGKCHQCDKMTKKKQLHITRMIWGRTIRRI